MMFSKKTFADMRRAGMGVGISKAKLSEAMLEVLLQLPTGSTNLKETIVANLGILGQMSPNRDIDQAWNQTKKKASKLYPDRFILDSRNVLVWNDGTTRLLDKDISAANFRKLNELAGTENCNVNAIVTKLIKAYQQSKS
jgi:hypothetical protein